MKQYKLEQFKNDVIQWSTDRLIIQNGTVKGQLNKLREEVNETIDGLLSLNLNEVKDGIGDCAVVLINLDALQKSNTNFHDLKAPTNMGVHELINSVRYYAENTTEDYSMAWERLVAFSDAYGVDFMECCEIAWNEIKDRKGYFCNVRKTFIKDSEGL